MIVSYVGYARSRSMRIVAPYTRRAPMTEEPPAPDIPRSPTSGDRSVVQPTPLRGAPRRSPKTAEIVARHLADYIIDNELPEGSPLPTEREMLEMLDIGRGTLREALRLRESWGPVEIRQGPQGGPVV